MVIQHPGDYISLAMALLAALREALAIEDRTRAAEQRARDAVARAHAADANARALEVDLAHAQREIRALLMDRYVARRDIHAVVPLIAFGNIEAAISRVCYVVDEHLTGDGGSEWQSEILLQSWLPPQRMTVYRYWPINVFKKLLELRYHTCVDHLLVMHAGIDLDDHRTLADYDLYDPSHEGSLPIFYLSQRAR